MTTKKFLFAFICFAIFATACEKQPVPTPEPEIEKGIYVLKEGKIYLNDTLYCEHPNSDILDMELDGNNLYSISKDAIYKNKSTLWNSADYGFTTVHGLSASNGTLHAVYATPSSSSGNLGPMKLYKISPTGIVTQIPNVFSQNTTLAECADIVTNSKGVSYALEIDYTADDMVKLHTISANDEVSSQNMPQVEDFYSKLQLDVNGDCWLMALSVYEENPLDNLSYVYYKNGKQDSTVDVGSNLFDFLFTMVGNDKYFAYSSFKKDKVYLLKNNQLIHTYTAKDIEDVMFFLNCFEIAPNGDIYMALRQYQLYTAYTPITTIYKNDQLIYQATGETIQKIIVVE